MILQCNIVLMSGLFWKGNSYTFLDVNCVHVLSVIFFIFLVR